MVGDKNQKHLQPQLMLSTHNQPPTTQTTFKLGRQRYKISHTELGRFIQPSRKEHSSFLSFILIMQYNITDVLKQNCYPLQSNKGSQEQSRNKHKGIKVLNDSVRNLHLLQLFSQSGSEFLPLFLRSVLLIFLVQPKN